VRSIDFTRVICLVIGILAILAGLQAARADQFSDALSRFTSSDFGERIAAVEKLAALGDPRAVPVLQALNDGALAVRKATNQIVIVRDGSATDPTNSQKLGASGSDDEVVRVNNRLRGVIRGALGRLMLFSPNVDERLAAAVGVYKTRGVENLPLLKKAVEIEKDARVAAQL
jgi:urea transport system permease protein